MQQPQPAAPSVRLERRLQPPQEARAAPKAKQRPPSAARLPSVVPPPGGWPGSSGASRSPPPAGQPCSPATAAVCTACMCALAAVAAAAVTLLSRPPAAPLPPRPGEHRAMSEVDVLRHAVRRLEAQLAARRRRPGRPDAAAAADQPAGSAECIASASAPLPGGRASLGPDIGALAQSEVRRRDQAWQTKEDAGGRRWGSRKGPVTVVSYAACGDAAEQHYAHLAALNIAVGVAADVLVLPHARHYSGAAGSRAWAETPLSAVYDVNTMRDHVAREGVAVRTAPWAPRSEARAEPPGTVGWDSDDLIAKLGLTGVKDAARVQIPPDVRPLWVWGKLLSRALLPYWRKGAVVLELGCLGRAVPLAAGLGLDADRDAIRAAHRAVRLAPAVQAAGAAAIEAARRRSSTAQYDAAVLPPPRRPGDRSQSAAAVTAEVLDWVPARPLYVAGEAGGAGAQGGGMPQRGGPPMLRRCGAPHCAGQWVDWQVLVEAERFAGPADSPLAMLVAEERALRGRGLAATLLASANGTGAEPAACCASPWCLTASCAAADGENPEDPRTALTEVRPVLPPGVEVPAAL
eukprot:TRINITY_DN35284_c0_g1_i1.p1 TRINITY_DN35284_c0_g1~~TRINITY_DN35284_c0_g1_i1.p1  ORF type:complete len:576 (+),score=78.88 TRINITY_DN35284_c0_g1_i1:71-1798(+)